MRDVTQLHPELQEKIAKLRLMCEAEGLALGIGECLRTVAEQDQLYAQGRTAPGPVVTYARGSTYASQHQWGIAFDIFQNIPGHAYDDVGFFRNVATMAKSLGLAWGGDWTSPVDMPHFYLPYWGDTPTTLKRQYVVPERFFVTWDRGAEKLEVDGWAGPKTVRRLQEVFGTQVDGVITDQYVVYRDDNPGLCSVEWVRMPVYGSALVRAIQEMVGADIDGVIGPATISAMQVYFGTPVDGCISGPSALIMAIQDWLNKHS